METKVCKKCDQDKNLSDFRKNHNCSTYRSTCYECEKKSNRERSKSQREEIKQCVQCKNNKALSKFNNCDTCTHCLTVVIPRKNKTLADRNYRRELKKQATIEKRNMLTPVRKEKAKKYKREYQKKAWRFNPNVKLREKKQQMRDISMVRDRYVKRKLKDYGFPKEYITQELIELKRKEIIAKRLINQI